MPLVEDLAAFYRTSEFAVSATLQGGTVVPVIFDAAAFDALGMTGSSPQARAIAASVAESAVGQTLVVNAVTYRIRNRSVLDDGAEVMLQLEKQ